MKTKRSTVLGRVQKLAEWIFWEWIAVLMVLFLYGINIHDFFEKWSVKMRHPAH
jgi:hypothetical protein